MAAVPKWAPTASPNSLLAAARANAGGPRRPLNGPACCLGQGGYNDIFMSLYLASQGRPQQASLSGQRTALPWRTPRQGRVGGRGKGGWTGAGGLAMRDEGAP